MRRARLPGLLAALLAGCAAVPPPPEAAPPAPAEWDRELPDGIRLVDFGDEEVANRVPVRVVEDATGAPIPGARVNGWGEAGTPGGLDWSEVLRFSEEADEDGWTLLSTEERPPWYYVEAPGFAPYGEMGMEDEYRLRPGEDVTVEVRDWLDRPLPGAVVEYMLGCGHTPNVRVETTGADGRCVFRCVDPERGFLWVRAAGIEGRNPAYDNGFDALEWGGDRWILRGCPAPPVEGRVLFADGTPAAGAAVGTYEAHRGPWTVTDGNGRFRLLGAPAWDTLEVHAWPPGEEDGLRTEFRTVPGVAATVRLPDPSTIQENGGIRPPAEGEEPPSLAVVVEAPGTVAAPDPVRVTLVREEDGLSWSSLLEFGEDRTAAGDFEVLPGRWRVAVTGGAGPLGPTAATVEVGAEGGEVVLRPPEAPVRRVRILRAGSGGAEPDEAPLPWPGDLFVEREDGRYAAVLAPGEGTIFVPAEGPFLLLYREEREEGFLEGRTPVGGASDGGAGPLTIVAGPAAPERPMTMLSVPYEGDFPEARLTVLLPDGTPAADAGVTVRGSPAPNLHYTMNLGLDEEGSLSYAFRRHDRVEVDPGDDTLSPLVFFADGPGPWTLRWPSTEVAVRAVDAGGTPLAEFAVVAGPWKSIHAEEGVVRLRGAPAGPLRLWVQAPGRRARALRIVLQESEHREVRAVLNPARAESGEEGTGSVEAPAVNAR